jgi:hypothetical protein
VVSRNGTRWLWTLGVALVMLVIYTASRLAQEVTIEERNAAAVLTLVAAGAVGIERIVEVFWTVVGMSKLGNWWPLKPIGDRLDAFVSQLDQPLHTFYERASQAVREASTESEEVRQGLKRAPEYLVELEKQIRNLKQLEPGSEYARAIAAQASRAVVGLKRLYPGLEGVAGAASGALAGVNRFVQTFEDNPARRLMSIYAGAVLGLLFAGLLGLDAFQATLGQKVLHDVAFVREYFPNIGIAATGLVIGLGATPTHEVIKLLKETKERRKAEAHKEGP